MGKQINFFLHQDDQQDFDNLLKSFGEVVLLPYYHFDSRISTVTDTLIRDVRKEGTRIYLVRPQDFNRMKLHHIEKFNYWLLQEIDLPVLHFDRSVFKDNTIERGRLYFQPQFVSNSQWVKKSEDFVKWADKIISATRRKLKKYKYHAGKYDYTEYLGSHALKWLEDNKAEVRDGGVRLIPNNVVTKK